MFGRVSGEFIKETREIFTKYGISAKDSKIIIEAGGLWVVISGAHMAVTTQGVAFFTNHQ